MGNSQGRDNVRKRASRRKKTERLALAKKAKHAKAPAKWLKTGEGRADMSKAVGQLSGSWE